MFGLKPREYLAVYVSVKLFCRCCEVFCFSLFKLSYYLGYITFLKERHQLYVKFWHFEVFWVSPFSQCVVWNNSEVVMWFLFVFTLLLCCIQCVFPMDHQVISFGFPFDFQTGHEKLWSPNMDHKEIKSGNSAATTHVGISPSNYCFTYHWISSDFSFGGVWPSYNHTEVYVFWKSC